MASDAVFVHPDAQLAITRAGQAPELAVETLLPAQLRAILDDRVANAPLEKVAMFEVRDLRVPGADGDLGIRMYRPSPAPVLPFCMFFHGGGFMLGNLETHDTLCRHLAARSGAALIAVDFRLSPEHAFPAAHEDCLRATQWVLAHASELGLDPGRFAVGGESSGGNLAASTALRLAALTPAVESRLQLLLYPLVDTSTDSPSFRQFGKGYLLTEERMRFYVSRYLQGADPADPRVSLLRAGNLAHTAPTFLLTAGLDPTLSHAEQFAEKLRLAGVSVEQVHFAGWPHGFLFWGHPQGSGAAIEAAGAALQRSLFPL